MIVIEAPYWVSEDTPTNDFNKEIVAPGVYEEFPLGAIGIRCDDNFWAVAALPWDFKDTPITELVALFFPWIDNPTFGEDVYA